MTLNIGIWVDGQTWMVKPSLQSNQVIHNTFNTSNNKCKIDHVANILQGYSQTCMELQCASEQCRLYKSLPPVMSNPYSFLSGKG